MNYCCRHPDACPTRLARGVTLVELMVVVAISAILAAVAIPQYSRYIGQRAIDAQISAMASSMRLARSEALKRAIPVTLCPSTSPESAAPQCAAGPGLDWSTGWIIFTDLGVRGLIDGSDTVIKIQPPSQNSGGMIGSMSTVTYSANGISIGNQGNFTLKNKAVPNDSSSSRSLCLNSTGSFRIC